MEIWKDIKGYEDLYQVSSLGRIVDKNNGYFSYQEILKDGGLAVVLVGSDNSRKVIRIERIVAQAFLDNPNHYITIRFKDGDRTNVAADNLEWAYKGVR